MTIDRPEKEERPLEELLMKEFIPSMLYSRKENDQFDSAQRQLRLFLKDYRFQDDVDAIIDLISSKDELHEREYKLLELYAKKIGAVRQEDFSAAEKHTASIQKIIGDMEGGGREE
jgi:hypothetical protein